MTTFSRRSMLGAAIACAFVPAALVAAPTDEVALTVTPARSTKMSIWVPKKARGVILFSTGHGSWPARYDAVARDWQAAGFVVLAPHHVDSVRHVDRAKFSRQASFPERLADMRAASAYAATRWSGKPVAAAGHSFGTLTALTMAGALARIGPFRDPTVKAVLGFSTPGKIPGLISPNAYESNAVPTMIVTGDRDVVPGLVTDWRDHLYPIETAPAGDKYALVLGGAEHELIGGADPVLFTNASRAGLDFLKAYVLGDRGAKRKLAAAVSSPGRAWTRR